MNKTQLIGRLVRDPELKYTPGKGTAVTTVTLACDKIGPDGQKQADFVPVVIWGKQAENTANLMSKGLLMGIVGRIQTRSYDAKDGSKRYVTEVVAEQVEFLTWGRKGQAGVKDRIDGDNNNGFFPGEFEPGEFNPEDGDIPF